MILLGSTAPAFAQVTETIKGGLTSAAGASGYTTGETNLPVIIGRLISAALGLLGVVLLAYILYGGFLWMTAAGETKKVEQARDIIKNAIIGLVIIVAAYSLTSFVLTQLGQVLTGTTPTPPTPK